MTSAITIDLATGRARPMTDREIQRTRREAELRSADDYAERHAAIVARMQAPLPDRCESGYILPDGADTCSAAARGDCPTCR